jgi:hypothetical protein
LLLSRFAFAVSHRWRAVNFICRCSCQGHTFFPPEMCPAALWPSRYGPIVRWKPAQNVSGRQRGTSPPSCPIGSRRPLSADLWVRSMGIKFPPKVFRYRCNGFQSTSDINLPSHEHSRSKNVLKLRAFAYFSKGFHSACESSRRSHRRRCGSHDVLQVCEIHQTLRTTPAMAAGVTRKLWKIADKVALLDQEY